MASIVYSSFSADLLSRNGDLSILQIDLTPCFLFQKPWTASPPRPIMLPCSIIDSMTFFDASRHALSFPNAYMTSSSSLMAMLMMTLFSITRARIVSPLYDRYLVRCGRLRWRNSSFEVGSLRCRSWRRRTISASPSMVVSDSMTTSTPYRSHRYKI